LPKIRQSYGDQDMIFILNISKRLSETGGVTSTDDVLAGLVNTPQTVSTVKVYGRVGTTDTDCKGIHVVVFGD